MDDRSAEPRRRDVLSQAVDLPATPLVVSDAEGELMGAKVVAHMLGGAALGGRLEALQSPRSQLTLLRDDDGARAEIPFSELRCLAFDQDIPRPRLPHPATSRGRDSMVPDAAQTFDVVYRDGRRYAGQSCASLVDDYGIHLFRIDQRGAVSRVFIPLAVVKECRIGPPLGEQLLQDKAISSADLNAVLAVQKVEEKAGNYLKARAAHTPEELRAALRQESGHRIEDVGSLLVNDGVITPEQLRDPETLRRGGRGRRLGEILQDLLKEAQRLSKEKPLVRLANGIFRRSASGRLGQPHRPWRASGRALATHRRRASLHTHVQQGLDAGAGEPHQDRWANGYRRALGAPGRAGTHRRPFKGRGLADLGAAHRRRGKRGGACAQRPGHRQGDWRARLSAVDAELLTDLLHRNNGIILVTGPSVAGKSTTLYAALGELVKQNVNIITSLAEVYRVRLR